MNGTDHGDEMSEGSSTNMDTTFIVDNDGYGTINYNGLDDKASPVFNITSTITLKKNLTEAFDKHAGRDDEVHAKCEGKSGVKAKIQAFEQKNKKHVHEHTKETKQKVRFQNLKPPIAPPVNQSLDESNSTLSVFLRVRPPSASEESVQNDQKATYNTVEIVKPNRDEKNSTKIRTYPPKESNASKVVRGQHHLHSHSANTELIFSKSSLESAESTVKGVKEFDFNQVFGPSSSQSDIYNEMAVPLVEGLFPSEKTKMAGDKVVGKSGLLFSYGITNAGKTYTIMGKDTNTLSRSDMGDIQDNHGIIPRAIHHILTNINELNQRAGKDAVRYELQMSYLEIYNEQVYDLLPKKSSIQSNKFGGLLPDNPLKLREERSGQVSVKGLAKYKVEDFSQGIKLAHDAKKRRHTSSNNINSDSSRSHSICQFKLIASPSEEFDLSRDSGSIASEGSGYATDDDSIASKISKQRSATLWIVDLAGSERSKRTGQFVGSARQKEARLINSSLMKLMRCFNALKENQTSNKASCVPFRESKLTHLFMGHLTGAAASRTSMIVNVNPSVADFDETQHVLSYATMAKTVQINRSEYDRKRQAIELIGVKGQHTHGEDGRPLKNKTSNKIAKVARKLSPRAILKRRQEQKQKNITQKRKEELENLRSGPGVARVKKAADGTKPRVAGNKRKLDDIGELKEKLNIERKKAARFENESKSLKEKLGNCEAEIRGELAAETEAQFRRMREQHDSIVSRLKQQYRNSCQTPKSSKKARLDRAEKAVEDMLDKVEECEEEMERMKDEHAQELQKLESVIMEKEETLLKEQSRYATDFERNRSEIERLETALHQSQMQVENLTREKDILAQQLSKQCHNRNSIDSYSPEEKENRYNGRATPSSTPRLRRLPRGRCSEVACANVSPQKDDPVSSAKKHRGLRLIGLKNNSQCKSPFREKALKSNTSEPEVDELMYPSSQPDYDEITGLFRRPRGRAPNGRCWDSEAGGWRLTA